MLKSKFTEYKTKLLKKEMEIYFCFRSTSASLKSNIFDFLFDHSPHYKQNIINENLVLGFQGSQSANTLPNFHTSVARTSARGLFFSFLQMTSIQFDSSQWDKIKKKKLENVVKQNGKRFVLPRLRCSSFQLQDNIT